MHIDLIRELEGIAALARAGMASLDQGRAVNGRGALARIAHAADDAVRHAGGAVDTQRAAA